MASYFINWVLSGHLNPRKGLSLNATMSLKNTYFKCQIPKFAFWGGPCMQYMVGMQFFIRVGTYSSEFLPECEVWALYLCNFLVYGPKCMTEIPYFPCRKSPDMHFWGLTAPFMDICQSCWIVYLEILLPKFLKLRKCKIEVKLEKPYTCEFCVFGKYKKISTLKLTMDYFVINDRYQWGSFILYSRNLLGLH